MTPAPSPIAAPPLRAPHGARPKRRILHIFDSLGIGGAEMWFIAFLEWLAKNGESLPFELEVEVCLTSGQRAALDDRAERLGAKLHYIRYGRRHLRCFATEFRRLLANGHFDAIHDHADYAAGLHLLIGAGTLPRARVVHVHNPYATFDKSLAKRMTRALGRLAVTSFATTVAGTSMRILHDYRMAPHPHTKQHRIAMHCGFDLSSYGADTHQARIDVRAEFGWTADAIILLFVGRLESHFNQKNPRLALDIILECIASDRRVKGLFAGAGDGVRHEMELEIERRGLADAVRLPGVRFDVPRLMLAADLLLFPSIAEGLGMVAVEAQAAGLRVLASDTTPRECEVVNGMVTFMSLAASPREWADVAQALLRAPAPPHDAAYQAVGNSPFSIASSARSMLDAYGFNSPAEL